MKNKKKLHILDCTLRDGGYYNNWNFSVKLTNSYLKSVSKTNINHVEIGFKSNVVDKNIGPTGKINDDFLRSIKVPKNIKLGVMINSNEFINRKNNSNTLIKDYFSNYSLKNLSFVRLATHIKDLPRITYAIKWLKKKNLFVAVNIMQISEIDKKNIRNYCNIFNKNKVDVLYLADSLGSLKQTQIKEILVNLKNILTMN